MMADNPYIQRNNPLVFAQYTRENLELIESLISNQATFHPVTQLINSLLGLLVFLKEKGLDSEVADLSVDDLAEKGWPKLKMSGETCKSLVRLVYHLRNVTAHGHLTFSSDSHKLSEVTITVEDFKPKQSIAYWRAQFNAAQLRELCFRFIALLEQKPV